MNPLQKKVCTLKGTARPLHTSDLFGLYLNRCLGYSLCLNVTKNKSKHRFLAAHPLSRCFMLHPSCQNMVKTFVEVLSDAVYRVPMKWEKQGP